MNIDKQTILVVDDTPENIDILLSTLKEDYNVKAAVNGTMALKIVHQSQPDLIMLDIMMPGMDGYEVCSILKRDHTTRHIPIIFTTAMSEIEDELKGLELGAVDYVTKPISPPIVKARVKSHLALYDQNRELNRKVAEQTHKLQDTRLQIIQRLGRAAEYRDNETGMHVIRMSHFSQLIGLGAGMAEAEASLLLNAAPMHDVGKIGIPDAILKKPAKLTPEEFEVMKTHCEIGAEILGDSDSELLNLARIVALTHHEKWNGSGYPKGLKAEEIPRVGRIVAIADVFDALTSIRPYKESWTVERATELIVNEKGSHFDPFLVDIFLEVLPEIEKVRLKYLDIFHGRQGAE